MGLRDRIAGAWHALRGRSAPPGYGISPTLTGGPFHQDAFGAKRGPTPHQLIEAYKSIIFFCANLNADRVSSLPLRLYAMSGSGMPAPRRACEPRPVPRALKQYVRSLPWLARTVAGAEDIREVTQHPFLELLDNPVPQDEDDWDRHSLINLFCRYIDIVGTAYAKPVSLGGEFPSELWPYQSQYVLPVRRSNSALIDHYTYFSETVPRDQVWRARLRPGLHDPYGPGYSAAQAACQYAGLEDEWVSMQTTLLGAGPRMGMIVSAADPRMPIGNDEAVKLEKELNAKYARGGANRVWVNRTGIKAQPITHPPVDLAGKEVAEYDLERIANCFNVPPPFYSKETNLANMQAAKEYHSEHAVQPRADCIASGFTRLVRRFDPRLFVAFDPACREDEQKRATIHDMKLKNGTLIIDEVRADDGNPPTEWGKEPWLPQTLVQPSTAEEQRQAQNEQAQQQLDAKATDKATDKGRSLDDRVKRTLALVEQELRSNPNHGQDGKFAHGSGAGSGGGGEELAEVQALVTHSFGAPPPKPGISHAKLARLENKILRQRERGEEVAPADLRQVLDGQSFLASRDARKRGEHGYLAFDPATANTGNMVDFDFKIVERDRHILREFGPDGKEIPPTSPAAIYDRIGPPAGKRLPSRRGVKYRFNPHHDSHTGEFSSGKGGSGGGGIGTATEPHHVPTAEAKAYHEAMSPGWKERLTKDQKVAVERYTYQTNEPINNLLRRGTATEGFSKAALEKDVARLDEALAGATLAEPVILYRGMGAAAAKGLKKGTVVEDKGFMSTSLSYDVAMGFTEGKGSALLEIHAPKGARAASLAGVTTLPTEREVLFARGARLKVTGKRKEGSWNIFTAEVAG